MAVDAAMRKLQIPPKFMPYMEKHRIYELFHNLGNQLAMAQPEDPIVFLKQCLQKLEKTRDRRLIILIAPPFVDRIELAHLMSVKTGCAILSRYLVCSKHVSFYDADMLAKNTAKIIKESNDDGWILADFPDTVEESKRLIKNGVIPTHAFLILPDEKKPTNLECYDNIKDDAIPNENARTIKATPSLLSTYDDSLHRLKDLFKSSLKVVKVENKDLEDIANACARLTMQMPQCHAPKTLRLVLMGPRGSRRRTLAKILQKKLGLVHVDMLDLINAGSVMENELGDEIRYLDKNNFPYPLRIVFELLKTRLYRQDCLDRGYVLTNFPTSVDDFVLLDSTNTPPNRVIFLDIEDGDCLERLEDRVVNQYTGKLYSKKNLVNTPLINSQSLTHPDDEACKVSEEIKFYNERVQAMKDYCGKTGFTVDGRGPITSLKERVEAVLMGPPPAAKPRSLKKLGKPSVKSLRSISSTVMTDNAVLADLSINGPPISSFRMASGVSGSSRISYPLSRMQIVPLIDSESLLKRYEEMRTGPRDQQGDFIPSELPIEKVDYNLDKKISSVGRMVDEIRNDSEFPDEQLEKPSINTIVSPKTSDKGNLSVQNSVLYNNGKSVNLSGPLNLSRNNLSRNNLSRNNLSRNNLSRNNLSAQDS